MFEVATAPLRIIEYAYAWQGIERTDVEPLISYAARRILRLQCAVAYTMLR